MSHINCKSPWRPGTFTHGKRLNIQFEHFISLDHIVLKIIAHNVLWALEPWSGIYTSPQGIKPLKTRHSQWFMRFEIYKLGIQRTNLYWRGLGCFRRSKRFHRFGVCRRCVEVKGAAIELNDVNVWEWNKWSLFKANTWPAFFSSLFFESWTWKMKLHVHFSFFEGK